MPRKAKKSKGSDLVLSCFLVDCMNKKTPFRIPGGDGREYAVFGPMRMNGDEFPYHLYAVDESAPGKRTEFRIAVDPFRKANGKPRKKANRNPVLAIMSVLEVSDGEDGPTASLEVRKIDSITSAFPDPNPDS